jgi:hypothetical protein
MAVPGHIRICAEGGVRLSTSKSGDTALERRRNDVSGISLLVVEIRPVNVRIGRIRWIP